MSQNPKSYLGNHNSLKFYINSDLGLPNEACFTSPENSDCLACFLTMWEVESCAFCAIRGASCFQRLLMPTQTWDMKARCSGSHPKS